MKEVGALLNVVNNESNEVNRAFFNSEIGDIERRNSWDGKEVSNFKDALLTAGIDYKKEARHGGEGQGEDFWTVYSFTKGNEKVLVQFDGWYQSYNGSEYTEWFFVEPKEVVVTQYFKVE
jgi:hypothetical protein